MFFIFVHIFITGFHDEGNLIATIISSRSIKAATAFGLAAISQFLGVVFIGTSVASTIGKSIIKYDYIIKSHDHLYLMLLTGILGAIVWNIITWYIEIPTSASHALIGGLLGPFFVEYGYKSINIYGTFIKVIAPLFISPMIGFIIGYIIMGISTILLYRFDPGVNKTLKRLQYITIFILNSSQGANDAQKGMGIIAIAMLQAGMTKSFTVPLWVKFISGLMISTGLILGGLKMIKSVGARIYKVRPLHSFNAQLASIIVIITSNLTGAPISGTQIINASVMGVGAKERPNGVRWQFVKNMMIAWLITIPASFMISIILYSIAHNL
ncbi:inorganic phosphate transporter, PiT family [Caldanaerobius fijiensis DSM 17918]|uniref:Inorganic phosphate transporter, PiT family n=2 Tax=Caldanaerobius TaxID=862261 RepID=A0A1M4TPR8_9THEO|nr:inorganic phosphate transporter, PiT family [Caldanaerobius fijiensis DSM 17918]